MVLKYFFYDFKFRNTKVKTKICKLNIMKNNQKEKVLEMDIKFNYFIYLLFLEKKKTFI